MCDLIQYSVSKGVVEMTVEDKIIELYSRGYYTHEIARELGLSESQVVRVLEDYGFLNM